MYYLCFNYMSVIPFQRGKPAEVIPFQRGKPAEVIPFQRGKLFRSQTSVDETIEVPEALISGLDA